MFSCMAYENPTLETRKCCMTMMFELDLTMAADSSKARCGGDVTGASHVP